MNPKVVQTIVEMLQDRGYEIEESENIIGKKEKCLVKIYHCDSPKIGIKHINEVIENIEQERFNKGIFIYSGVLSSFAKHLLTDNKSFLQYFHEDELSFNITHHKYVPEHKILPIETKKQIMNKYKISEKQLPWISSSDPVIKYHGGCVGDLVRITRDNKDGLSVTYRLCV